MAALALAKPASIPSKRVLFLSCLVISEIPCEGDGEGDGEGEGWSLSKVGLGGGSKRIGEEKD